MLYYYFRNLFNAPKKLKYVKEQISKLFSGHLIYNADIPQRGITVLGTFKEDVPEVALNNINQRTKDWKIKFNGVKCVHILYTLSHQNRSLKLFIHGMVTPPAE